MTILGEWETNLNTKTRNTILQRYKNTSLSSSVPFLTLVHLTQGNFSRVYWTTFWSCSAYETDGEM
jgi:hypothetical protein